MSNIQMTDNDYKRNFSRRKIKEALKQAYEIRKFEIELYWKRATYFWTFIGAAFVGYSAVYTSKLETNEKELILIIISCLGFVFSVAWHCVNKGSKFWQENWENHVELLEDAVFGPLYKTLTKRPKRPFSVGHFLEDWFVAPKPFSVSKINQLISTFMALVWGLILYSSIGEICFSSCEIIWKKTIPVCLTLITCISFWIIGKSHEGEHTPEVYLRETKVKPPTH